MNYIDLCPSLYFICALLSMVIMCQNITVAKRNAMKETDGSETIYYKVQERQESVFPAKKNKIKHAKMSQANVWMSLHGFIIE